MTFKDFQRVLLQLRCCDARFMRLVALWMVGLFAIWKSTSCAGADELDRVDFFESKVRPLLIARCQSCHGEAKQWAGLRLDSAEAVARGGESGPAIKPHRPEESQLLLRVIQTDESLRMPPPESGPELTADQAAALRHWIETGAVWPAAAANRDAPMSDLESVRQSHWAFRPMQMPLIPSARLDHAHPSPVDAFIQAKLSDAGMSLSAPADKRTLIRRVTYDLTGLPPTYDEVQSFVNDESPDAYERLLDRLLDSPRYGEHWARHWLDVARYSDSKGYVYAREERFFIHSSHYRDWVIKAFNEDMPYDQFLLLQLAADRVVPAQSESLAAMGFLTLGRRFLGVTPDIIDDRIDVVCRGLMGLTVGCARCHDHKYDPIPTADYYSLYGVFQNSVEHVEPLSAPKSEAHKEFVAGLQERQKKYDDYFSAQRAEAELRFRTRIADYLLAQRELDKYPEQTFNQLVNKEDMIPGVVHLWSSYLEQCEEAGDPIFAAWIAFAKLGDEEFETKAAGVCQSLQQRSNSIHPKVLAAFSECPKSAKEVADRYGKLFADVERAWNELCEAAKRDGQAAPLALPDAQDETLRQSLLRPGVPCVIPNVPVANTEWYWDTGTVVELWQKQGEVDRWLIQHPAQLPHATTLVDQATPSNSRIFRRGNPANKGPIVPRQFLSAIEGSNRKAFQVGSGRHELAQALVQPTNPLTARVWVNRVWLHHFGQGLVTTPSDFGLRAIPPSHPELLDWLALNFIEHRWSTRWLHKTMMMSETYRQSCRGPTTPSEHTRFVQHDPGNRLLWRMNPTRLSFEEMRDTMISVTGEVDWSMGGKPVDLFASVPTAQGSRFRRTIYGQVDRQFLPTVFNVFDFANPDLHSPQRNETTVPQQALFSLNHPFVAARARALAARVLKNPSPNNTDRLRSLYHVLYQRDPTPHQMEMALLFLNSHVEPESEEGVELARAWSYGVGAVDETGGKTKSFERLPYSNAVAWQGGTQLPDAKLGWVHIGARTIHSGNDKDHSAIRRWTAPTNGTATIRSLASHEHPQGDGARGLVISSRHGILKSEVLFNSRSQWDFEKIEVQMGDTIDFVVELYETLNYEDLTWAPTIDLVPADSTKPACQWDAAKNFRTSDSGMLSPWEQLAQVLLISNETMFLD
jgi:hypothetical protein